MERAVRWISCIGLCLLALILSRHFVEYRVQPVFASSSAPDFSPLAEDQILFLGRTTLDPPPKSELARFNGRIGAERGVFSRTGYSKEVAIAGGIVLPLSLTSLALLVAFRRRRPKS